MTSVGSSAVRKRKIEHLADLADEAFVEGEVKRSIQLLDLIYEEIDWQQRRAAGTSLASGRRAVRRIHCGHGHLPTTSFAMGCHRMAEAVLEHPELAGVIEIDVVGFGDELSMMRDVQRNELEMAVGASSVLVEFCPEIGIMDAPFLFSDVVRGRAAFDGEVGEEYAAMLRGAGIHVLAWLENGLRQITSNTPVRRVSDLRGLQLRVPQSPVSVDGFAALGAAPQAMPFGKVHDALRLGQVVAAETPLSGIVVARFHEVQKYLCLASHSYSVGLVAASRGLMESLTRRQAAALLSCAREGRLESIRAADRVFRAGILKLQHQGMTVVADIERDEFCRAMRPFHEELDAQIGGGRVEKLLQAQA